MKKIKLDNSVRIMMKPGGVLTLSSPVLFLGLLFTASFVHAQTESARVPYRIDNKWGFADLKGVIKIQPVYDSVQIPDNMNTFSLMVFKNNGSDKAGIIDYQGKVLVDTQYDKIEYHLNRFLTYTTTKYVKDQNGKITSTLQSLISKEGKVMIPEGPYKIRYPEFDMYQTDYHEHTGGSRMFIFKPGSPLLLQELVFTGAGDADLNDEGEIVWRKDDGEILYYVKNASGKYTLSKKAKGATRNRMNVVEQVLPIENSNVSEPKYKAVLTFDHRTIVIEGSPEDQPGIKRMIGTRISPQVLTKKVKLHPSLEISQHVLEGQTYQRRKTLFDEWYYEHLPDQGQYVVMFPWVKKVLTIEADLISENILHYSDEVILKIKRGNKWYAYSTDTGVITPDGYSEILLHATDSAKGINHCEYVNFLYKENGKYGMMNKYGKVLLTKGYDRIEYIDGYNRLIENNLVNFYVYHKEYPAQLPLDYYSISKTEMLYDREENFHVLIWVFKKTTDRMLPGLVSIEGVKFFKE